jgi:hypothetical protein
MTVTVSAAAVRRILVGVTIVVCLVGLAVELLRHLGELDHAALSMWSLSYEGNMPSWYASVLPLVCAGLLAWISAGEAQDRGYWRALALGFLYISIDEAVGLHELLSLLFDTEGVLHFGWVIPAAGVVLVVGLAFVGFLRRLDRPTARRFVLAGGLYVGGAVACELPLGWWTEHHGDDSLGYALIDWVEETLEYVGLTLFAATLLGRLGGRGLRVTRPDDAPTR